MFEILFLFILISLYNFLIPYLDSFQYGFIYQFSIKKLNSYNIGIFNHSIFYKLFNMFEKQWKWIFQEKIDSDGHTVVKRYRILQKIIEIISGILLFYLIIFVLGFVWYIGLISLLCIVMTYIFTTYEFEFYIMLNQLDSVKIYKAPHWLLRKYFILYYIQPYSYKKFKTASKIGLCMSYTVPIILLIIKLLSFIN